MAMRLVRDEPDVQIDEVRATGVENDDHVLKDLGRAARRSLRTLNARMRMSRKSLSQVIAVPDFGEEARAEEASASDDAGAGRAAVPPPTERANDARSRPSDASSVDSASLDSASVESSSLDEMSDGAVPPTEPAVGELQTEDESADEAAGSVPVALPTLEALLLTTHHPLTPARLGELLDGASTRAVRDAVKSLNDSYESTGRSFRIEQVAGGYQILTMPEHGDALRRLHQKDADAKLTKAALETLSIIAYKQPILRADVEAIRGVACGETIRSLMEKHLVKIAGRAEEPGRPILYGTTKRFLELFGLNSLKDLPRPEEFKLGPQAG